MSQHGDFQRLVPVRTAPVVITEEDPWTPSGVDPKVIDAAWQAICEANPRAFDGQVLHVLDVQGTDEGTVTIRVAPCAYRYYAVQVNGLDCGARTLGAKALVYSEDRLLLGQRADWVMYYPGQWEFVPGGSVQPGQSPEETILEELQEETGCHAVESPESLAVTYDPQAYSWEVIHRIRLKANATPVGSLEYDQLNWFRSTDLPAGLSPIAQRMTALCNA
ncbi:MAG: NUDIX domain-containing protein [Phycisphaerales bacterium]|nr:NUDIX domain-containing protein [Phycisphaerales bacterium]